MIQRHNPNKIIQNFTTLWEKINHQEGDLSLKHSNQRLVVRLKNDVSWFLNQIVAMSIIYHILWIH